MADARVISDGPWSETLRRLGPAGKLRAAHRLYFAARHLKEAAIRRKHPDWNPVQVRQSLDEIFWNARN